jgi:hypothetical protein
MTPVNGEAAAATWGAEHADPVVGLRGWALQSRASLVVFAAAFVVAAVRMLVWPSALRQDQWVYIFTGQALASLHRPVEVAQYSTTTPKPLATLLALVVAPLPADRGFAWVMIVATAVLVTATFAYGRRVGGTLGALIAVAALTLLPGLPPAMYGGEIDVVSAALIVLSIVSGRRTRVALMILLGLLRPLAWPLAGVAAFLAARGSLPRRLALGVLGAAAPVGIWLLNDALLYGNPLASYRANDRINSHVAPESLIGALDRAVHGVEHGAGPVLFAIGLLGLAVVISRRPWRADPFPTWLLVGYLAALVVTWMRMPYNARYALPVVVLWPLYAAHLAAPLRLSGRLRDAAAPAVVGAVVVFAAVAAHMTMDPDGLRRAQLTEQMLGSRATVDRALACGPVGVRRGYSGIELAAERGRSFRDFWFPPAALAGAPTELLPTHIVALKPRIRSLRHRGWRSAVVPLGRLWISPDCRL